MRRTWPAVPAASGRAMPRRVRFLRSPAFPTRSVARRASDPVSCPREAPVASCPSAPAIAASAGTPCSYRRPCRRFDGLALAYVADVALTEREMASSKEGGDERSARAGPAALDVVLALVTGMVVGGTTPQVAGKEPAP